MSQQWKVLLAFTGIFVAGAVAGGIVALRVGAEHAAAQTQSPMPTPPPKTVVSPANFSFAKMQQLISQLGLSSAQREEIQPIVNSTGERLKKLSQESASQTRALLDQMDVDVEALLNPDQRVTLANNKKKGQGQGRFDQPNGGPGRGFGPGRGIPGGDIRPPNGNTLSGLGPMGGGRRGGPEESQAQSSPTPASADQDPVQ